MIYGKIRELKFYKGISKNLDKAIEIIEKGEYKNGIPGKNIIDGDDLFYNYQITKTQPINERFFEGHKEYIDIHIIIKGREKIGYTSRSKVIRTVPWDKEKDLEIYEGPIDNIYEMEEDTFIIFFPEEPHIALIEAEEGAMDIEKALFKIRK